MYRVGVAKACHDMLPAKRPNECLGSIDKARGPRCKRFEKFGFGQPQAAFLDELRGERSRGHLTALEEVHCTRPEPTVQHFVFAHAWE
jgi:hypothetical protein